MPSYIKNHYVYCFSLHYWLIFSDLSIKRYTISLAWLVYNESLWVLNDLSSFPPFLPLPPFLSFFCQELKKNTPQIVENFFPRNHSQFYGSIIPQNIQFSLSFFLEKQDIYSFSLDFSFHECRKICSLTTSQKMPEPCNSLTPFTPSCQNNLHLLSACYVSML